MTSPVNIYLVSLGCAKNQVNSEQMLWLLQQAGHRLVEDPALAQVAIVNTCGFIDSATGEAIERVLELAAYKEAGSLQKLLVTGCMTQRYGVQVLEQLPEVDGILGTGSYDQIVAAVEQALAGERPTLFGDINASQEETPRIRSTPPWTAYLKIAEGCDNHCAYCVIPSLRGKFRSRRMEDVLAEAEDFAADGVKELIVVAQDITRYGTDLYGRRRLAELTRALCRIPGVEWVRLHYLYPDEVDDELIDAIADEPKVVKYLDIPLQHANDAILRAMNRRSTKAQMLALITKLRARIPDLVLRTSLICGLPGEGEAEFEKLAEFLAETRMERVGVFPFSPQEGTEAAKMGGCAEESVVNERIRLITDLQSDIMDEYNEAMCGRDLTILCEGIDAETGLYVGRSYADSPDIDGRVLFTSAECLSGGDMPVVHITGAVDGELRGEALCVCP